MSQGVFISFEGLDGAGKSTQLRLLGRELSDRGWPVVSLRQPGGTPLGDRIRTLLLDSRNDSVTGGIAPAAELALMFADRAQSINQVIRPALATGAIVLCDRYTDSSEAYQGAGRELGPERVRLVHRAVCDGLDPDLTILLLPPLEASLHRARRRNQRHLEISGSDENRFEREDDAFYHRVYAQYEEIARREPKRVLAFRQNGSIEAIAGQVLTTVLERLGSRGATSRAGSQNLAPRSL